MPISRTYNAGSIVYFQGDKDVEEVYVLQQGRVVLISTALDSGEEIREEVQVGEFFGVRSSVGRYIREETAQVVGKTQLLVFKISEFEQFVLKNTRLIMKMLRVFSKQLRNIHRQVRESLKVGAARDPSYELMNVAESFHKHGEMDHAIYAYEKYMEHYPGGMYSERASSLMEMAQNGSPFPFNFPTLDSVEGGHGGKDDFAGGFGIAGDDNANVDTGGMSDLFYNAMSLFSRGEYESALNNYREILSGNPSGDDEREITGKTYFEKGRCELKLKKLDDAAASFTFYVKNYSGGEFVKEAVYQLAVITEAKGNKERARALYMKVATMKPADSITTEAKKRLERLG